MVEVRSGMSIYSEISCNCILLHSLHVSTVSHSPAHVHPENVFNLYALQPVHNNKQCMQYDLGPGCVCTLITLRVLVTGTPVRIAPPIRYPIRTLPGTTKRTRFIVSET